MQKQAGNLAWQLPYGDCAFPMAGSCIVTNPAATTMPAQEHFAPYCCFRQPGLRCALAQTRHHVPDSWASLSRCATKTTCTHNCDMLRKRYAHHCTQNCSGQVHHKFTGWTYGWQTSLQRLQPYNALGGSCSGSPQLKSHLGLSSPCSTLSMCLRLAIKVTQEGSAYAAKNDTNHCFPYVHKK